MVGPQRGGTPDRRSERLGRRKGTVIVHDLPDTTPRSTEDIGTRSGSPRRDRDPRSEQAHTSESEGISVFESEGELSGDKMPTSTRLKYSRFRGDGSQDVDDWFCEFESIAMANQEEQEAKRRIFQGLLKGEALKWYQDVPDTTRDSWSDFVSLFLRTFREAGGEARALGRLSRITMKPAESVRKYGQRVKALIQKLTTEIAPSVQVEWYVAGFPEEMGFQIRQARPTSLREAMEAAQNYENSAQSLRKSMKRSGKKAQKKKKERRKKSSESEPSDSSTGSGSATSPSPSSDSDRETRARNRNRGNEKGRRSTALVKVKVEEDESRKVMKSIQETLAAIQVNLAENRKSRKLVPTSRANVWCPRCGETGHFANECTRPTQKRVQFVNPEEEVYYTMAEEEEGGEDTISVYQIQPTYGRGKAVQQPSRPKVPLQVNHPGSGQGTSTQPHYPARPTGYCFNCGSPDHYANVCPFSRQGQGAPRILPCQNCQEYGHSAPQCPRPQQVRIAYKQVEVPPRDQTGLNYGHSTGIENPEK